MHGLFFEPPITKNYVGHILSEIYRDNIYAPLVTPNADVVLDIGANIGLTTYYFSDKFKKVISLEPCKEHFEVMNRMLSFNKIENVTTVNKALYIKSGNFPLYHNAENNTMFSLHSALAGASDKTEIVPTTTLKEIFESHGLEKVDLMKLDVEGSEVEIISHSDFQELAPKIDKVIIEYHTWSGRGQQQLIDALENAGYTVGQMKSDASLFYGTHENKNNKTPQT